MININKYLKNIFLRLKNNKIRLTNKNKKIKQIFYDNRYNIFHKLPNLKYENIINCYIDHSTPKIHNTYKTSIICTMGTIRNETKNYS